jgi:capsular polysaccharide biosynthesis protein
MKLSVKPLGKLASVDTQAKVVKPGRASKDARTAGVYHYADATEPGLAETWAGFDAEYLAGPRYLAKWQVTLEDAIVHPAFGIVQVGSQLVRETIRSSNMLSSTFSEIDKAEARGIVKGKAFADVADPVVAQTIPAATLLGWGLSANYFNWTLRYAASATLKSEDAHPLLLTPDLTFGFQRKTLEFLRIAQDRIVQAKGPTRVSKLTLTSPMALGRYDLSPLLPTALRDSPAVKQIWRDAKEKIYIPRGDDVKMRKVVNASAVEAAMQKLGFKVIDAGRLPMADQVRTFKNADVVVAAHGAALTNIVYCDPGTRVLEIIPEGYDQGVTSYRSLADMFDLNYEAMFAKEAKVDPKGNRCNSDIEIAVKPLIDLLS